MATRRTCGVVCVVVLVLTCMTTAAWAQFASSLEGTVSDSTGGLVPGASVTILNESTGATQTVTTTGAGYYRFAALPGSTYTVRVTLGSHCWANSAIAGSTAGLFGTS